VTEAANAAVISDVATDYQRSECFFFFVPLYMCLHTTAYVSSHYYICTAAYVSSHFCMCPHTPLSAQSVFFFHTTICVQHTTEYLSSHYYICVRIRLSAQSAPRSRITSVFFPPCYHICVRILLHMYVLTLLYMCPHTPVTAHSAPRLPLCHSDLADLIHVTRITNLILLI
jgi:hypothetical protein